MKRSSNRISQAFPILCFCLLAAAAPLSTASEDGLEHVRRAHYVMGTVFEIEAYGSDANRTAAAVEEAFQAIRQADAILSDYRDDSELSRLNRDGPQGFVALSPDLYGVLQTSAEYSRVTDSAFDVTVGPLVDTWRQASNEDRWPEDGELSRVRSLVGFGRLQFDAARLAARFEQPGMRVDFGGIGKGWSIDRAAEVLRKQGIERALISAGTSTVYALGAPPGEAAWKIAIRHPLREDDALAVVSLRDESMSTSASYEQDDEIAGKPYSHILDPRMGLPVEGMWSATVIAPTAAESDALSTASFVLGIEQSERLLRERGLSAILAAKGRGEEDLVVRRITSPRRTSFWSDGGRDEGSDGGEGPGSDARQERHGRSAHD